VPHKIIPNEYIIIEDDWAYSLKKSLENVDLSKEKTLDMLNPILKIKDKDGTYIGARMGRPEKSKMRKINRLGFIGYYYSRPISRVRVSS